MRDAKLAATVIICQMAGDRPAIITKVFSATAFEACGFMPEPEVLKLVTLHDCRDRALIAGAKGLGFHAYWPAKE